MFDLEFQKFFHILDIYGKIQICFYIQPYNNDI